MFLRFAVAFLEYSENLHLIRGEKKGVPENKKHQSETVYYQTSYNVDFVTFCTEFRMLSVQADFRTKERRLLMTHTSTEAENAQVSSCDDRNWFASVFIEHGVFQLRRSKRVAVAPHRLSTTTKYTIFSS